MSTYPVQLVLPDEVIDSLPADSKQWVPYLITFFESTVLKTYEDSLRRRQQGSIMGKGLSRYEKSMMLDFLVDIALGQLRNRVETESSYENHAVGRTA